MAFLPRAHAAPLAATHAPFGRHPTRDELFLVPDAERYAGTYVLGVQGAGKSGLLHTLIQRDIAAGHAVVVLDPHGDLITNCLASLPEGRVKDTSVLDLEDEGYPFGANLFSSGKLQTDVAKTAARERILRVFEVLWPDVMGQANLPRYARAATIVLLDNPGSTLVDMYELLINRTARDRLLTNVTDPTVKQFWALFDELSPSKQQMTIQPLLNRLESLFMGQALVRNVVGQRKSTISFRRVMENRELVFIRLPLKSLGAEARLIGTILLSQLSAAVFSFGDTPHTDRPGVSLFVDECQNFATPDFASLLSEGRKFGVRMTLAHQYRAQLPDYLKKSTMTARTKVIFTVTPEDGRELGTLFSGAAGSFEINEKPVAWLLTHDHPDESVRYFTEYYLRPLRGNRQLLNVVDQSIGWREMLTMVVDAPSLNDPVRVPDPLYPLNSLLLAVMQQRNSNVPIPFEIPLGFSGCGRHPFLHALRRAREELQPDYAFPDWLGRRDPQDGREQLLHFLMVLRCCLDGLAEQPIGVQLEASASEVGRMLSSLPKRAAFVRSGEDSGVIYTLDTPQPLTGTDLNERLDAIQEHTRRTYAHPRDNVERSRTGASTTTESEMMVVEEVAAAAETGEPEPVAVASSAPAPLATASDPAHAQMRSSHWDELLEDY